MGFENGKLLRVAVTATLGDDSQVMVLHYDLQDVPGPDDNDPQSLADTFADDVLPAARALFSSDWTVEPVVVTEELDPQDPLAPRQQWTAGTAAVGTKSIATDLLPRAVCGLISWRTSLIGRRFRGRTFVFGTHTEGDQAAGVWTSTKMGFLETFADAIPVQPDISPPLSEATANLCVYSRTARAADQDPYAQHVIGHVVDDNVHWLRSRQRS